MSDERASVEVPAAVDQAARATQGEAAVTVKSEDDIVEAMKKQIADLEERERKKDEELAIARRFGADQQRARESAESKQREAERTAEQARNTSERTVDDSRLDAINASIAARSEQMRSLEAQYAAAFSEGDATKVASLQSQISRLAAEQVTLESGKAELESRKSGREATDSTVRVREGAPAPEDSKERWIRQQPPRIQDWLRSPNGSRFFTDSDFQAKVSAAAAYAQHNRGIDPSSQAYIDYVEEQVGLRQPPRRDEPSEQRQTNSQQTRGRDAGDERLITAPAGGSTQGTPRPSSNEVYLTAAERETARFLGVSEAEYAKNKRDLQNEGLIGPNARSR